MNKKKELLQGILYLLMAIAIMLVAAKWALLNWEKIEEIDALKNSKNVEESY